MHLLLSFLCIMNRLAVDAHNGRRSLMDLSHRMVKNFFEILSTPKKVDLGYLTQLNDSDILVSVRESSVPGQPQGTIVCLATTLQLPVFYENLFAFFKDEKTRAQVCVLVCSSLIVTSICE